jgi:hypothetical protein
MGILGNLFYDITRPIRELRSKVHGVKNLRDGLLGDVNRIKRSVGIKDQPAPPPPAQGDDTKNKP